MHEERVRFSPSIQRSSNQSQSDYEPHVTRFNKQQTSSEYREGFTREILTATEIREIETRIRLVETAFRKLERANTKFIAEIEQEQGTLVVAVIPTPTGDSYASFQDALDSAFSDMPDRARESAIELRAELLQRYVSFETPIRVVQAFFPYSEAEARKATFSETYVDREESLMLNDDGSVTFKNFRGSRGFADGGTARYRYLFEEYMQISKRDTFGK